MLQRRFDAVRDIALLTVAVTGVPRDVGETIERLAEIPEFAFDGRAARVVGPEREKRVQQLADPLADVDVDLRHHPLHAGDMAHALVVGPRLLHRRECPWRIPRGFCRFCCQYAVHLLASPP